MRKRKLHELHEGEKVLVPFRDNRRLSRAEIGCGWASVHMVCLQKGGEMERVED